MKRRRALAKKSKAAKKTALLKKSKRVKKSTRVRTARPVKKSWTRMKEVLVIMPAEDLTSAKDNAWSRVFESLAREWRVFMVRAPLRGESVAMGSAGLDAVSVDTFPAIKRVLSEHLISSVFLVGASTVETCLESLHSFAAHIPYIAVLDEPWPAEMQTNAKLARIEFVVGLADRLLLTNPVNSARIQPFLRRLPLEIDIIPRADDAAGLKRFVDTLSTGIQDAFQSTQSALTDKTPPAMAGLLPRTGAASLEKNLRDWRRSLPNVVERTFVAPSAVSASERRRLDRAWPRSRWLFYRDDQHRIDLLNRTLRAGKTEFALVLNEAAVLQPLCLERLLACGRKLPLVAGVTYNLSTEQAPSTWAQAAASGAAWAMRFNGSYRAVPYVHDDCFLIKRTALDAVGSFDARLDWQLAVRDYCLRIRQSGLNLFIAEDAVAFSAPRASNGSDKSFNDLFVDKWNLDPLALTEQ